MSRNRDAAPFLRLVAGTEIVVRDSAGESAVGEPPADFNGRERVEWHRVVAAMSSHGPLGENDRVVIACMARTGASLAVLNERMRLTGSFGRIGPAADFVNQEYDRLRQEFVDSLMLRRGGSRAPAFRE